MIIPFLDLQAAYLELRPELDAAFQRVMEGGWYILGEEVEAFEREFATACGARHCVGVGNGLDALHLLLRAHGVGPGAEVIVPSNTFIATWLTVTHCGATPVPVEPDSGTYTLDPSRIERAITPRTRAVLAVHLYGQPADIDAIRSLAAPRGILVLEDAAQSHGATDRGRPVGSLADGAAFSFYPAKNLGAYGDAGAVTTDDDRLADRIRLLRNYGSRRKYVHELKGLNSRLDPLQAALLRVKLHHLAEWNARRTRLAAAYAEGLAGLEQEIARPSVPDRCAPVWHLYVVRSTRRDALQRHLAHQGIATSIHYPVPPHLSDAYAGAFAPTELPLARRLAAEVLSLPIGPHMSIESVDEVCRAIRSFFQRQA